MNGNESGDRISGEQGSVKPEETLTDIVRQVAYARADGERGAMRAAANAAFLGWLARFETSDVEEDREILRFALKQQGFSDWQDFLDAWNASGEPAMSARQQLENLDVADIQERVGFDLDEVEEDGGDND